MKNIRKYLKELGMQRIYFFALFFGIGLLVAGFICPPLAVIDKSVLIAVGEIIIFVDAPIVVMIASTRPMRLGFDIDDKKIYLDSTKDKDEQND